MLCALPIRTPSASPARFVAAPPALRELSKCHDAIIELIVGGTAVQTIENVKDIIKELGQNLMLYDRKIQVAERHILRLVDSFENEMYA